MRRCLLVMAGGTGGHVFPGIAVADVLRARGWHIHWLGTASRMEAQIVPKAGYSISFVSVAGVRGNGLLRKLAAPFQIIKSVTQAIRVIKQVKPDLVLGMGGFASGPGGVAARMLGVPLLLHEQNAVPGLTNKLLAKIAQQVFTGFDATFSAQQAGNAKYLWVGNPVRAEFSPQSEKQQIRLPLKILVVGGSLGAKALNEEVPAAVKHLSDIEVRHQCGRGNQAEVKARYQRLLGEQIQWQVDEFIEDMAAAYRRADLLICRAGALTVAEVAACGVAAVFVPLPHAVDDHQTSNARTLSDQGAAFLLPQKNLCQGELVTILNRLLAAPEQLAEIGEKARKLAKYDASLTLADYCEQITERAA